MVCVNYIMTFKIHFLTSVPYFFHMDIYITAVYTSTSSYKGVIIHTTNTVANSSFCSEQPDVISK